MRAGDLIGPTGSPGIWELLRERGHVTSTHHQLSQILLAQLAGSGVISQFPKVPREISSPAGPSSKRTGDRFTGWSGLLGSDKEPKLRAQSTPTHITSDEINLHHWIQPTTNPKTTSEMELVHSTYNYSREIMQSFLCKSLKWKWKKYILVSCRMKRYQLMSQVYLFCSACGDCSWTFYRFHHTFVMPTVQWWATLQETVSKMKIKTESMIVIATDDYGFPNISNLNNRFLLHGCCSFGGKKRQNLQAFLKETVQCRKKSKKM